VHALKTILIEAVYRFVPESMEPREVEGSLKKLIFFDVSLVFDTYIHSLLDEIKTEREKTEQYARDLEEQVRIRTEQLEERSRTDALTGLLNMRHLTEVLNRNLRASERRNEPLCFAFIDLDGFKEINDEYGHKHGDMVLKAVATALLESVRAEDTCFRYGGDEFCVILPRCHFDEAFRIVDQRLRGQLTVLMKDFPMQVGFSVGISEARPGAYPEADALIQRADERMYELKAVAKHSADDDTQAAESKPPVSIEVDAASNGLPKTKSR
jgi:diguanylate cyclase